MMASSIEFMVADQDTGEMQFLRRLLPFLKIGSGNLSVIGKAYCLLWQLHLVFGSDGQTLRRAISKIAG